MNATKPSEVGMQGSGVANPGCHQSLCLYRSIQYKMQNRNERQGTHFTDVSLDLLKHQVNNSCYSFYHRIFNPYCTIQSQLTRGLAQLITLGDRLGDPWLGNSPTMGQLSLHFVHLPPKDQSSTSINHSEKKTGISGQKQMIDL